MRTQKKDDNNRKDEKRQRLQPQQQPQQQQQQQPRQPQPQQQSQRQQQLKPKPRPKPKRKPKPRKDPFKPAYMVDTLPSDVVLLDEVQRQLGIEVKPQGDNPIFLLAFIFFYLLYTPMDHFSKIDISLGTVLGIACAGTFAILLNLGEVKVSGTYFQPAALFSLVFSVIVTGLYASKDPGGTLIYFLISLFFGYVCVRPYGKTIIYAEPFWIPLPFVGLVTFEKFTPLIVSIPYVTFFLFDVLHARRSKHIVVGGAKERDALFHVPGGICAIAIVIVFYSYFMKIDLSYTAREIKRSTLLLVHGVLDGVIHVVQSLVREIVGRVSELLTHIQPR